MDKKESASANKHDDMEGDESVEDSPNHSAVTRNLQDLEAKTREIVHVAAAADTATEKADTLSIMWQNADPKSIATTTTSTATPPPTAMLQQTTTIGAQRISGMYGQEESTNSIAFADFDEYDTESTVALATTTSADAYWQTRATLPSPLSMVSSVSDSSASYLVEATTVPELVSARAILMTPISEDGRQQRDNIRGNDDNDNNEKESIARGDDDTADKGNSTCRHRRGLHLAIALLVIVIVALALGVALGKSLSGSTINNTSSSTTENTQRNNSSSNSNDTFSNSTNILQHQTPTSSPTANNNNVQIYLTTLNAHRCDSGYMFDITAKTDMEILALQINMNTQSTQLIDVWTKPGAFHGFETNQSSWTLLAQTNVTPSASRSNNLVALPRNLFSPIHLSPGSQQALYVTAREKVICFQVSLKSLVGLVSYESVAFNTTDFDLQVGTGVSYLFGGFGQPSIFSGIIEYERTWN